MIMDHKQIKRNPHLAKQALTFKGELVENKEDHDLFPSTELMQENPYKTPPNNLTSKDKEFEEKA
jgi:hypothetical protein